MARKPDEAIFIELVAEEIKTPLDSTNEGLVGMLLHF
jgi:hypothetical protein